jgi:hypothetical protein
MKFGKELGDSRDARVASGVACAVCGAAAVLQVELGVRKREHATAVRPPVRHLMGLCPEHGGALPLDTIARIVAGLAVVVDAPYTRRIAAMVLRDLGLDGWDSLDRLVSQIVARGAELANSEPERS